MTPAELVVAAALAAVLVALVAAVVAWRARSCAACGARPAEAVAVVVARLDDDPGRVLVYRGRLCGACRKVAGQ